MKLEPYRRANQLVGYVVFGSLGALIFCSYWWFLGRIAPARAGTTPQQEQPKKPSPPIVQKSEGPNSPNIIGNNNTVTVNLPPHTPPPQPTFHEKAEMVSFSFGNGISDIQSIEALRRATRPHAPFNFGGFVPVTLRMRGDTLLLHFKVWGGEGKPPIEVNDNEFTVRVPGWDRNSNANALEVINADGVPVFQMIRKTPLEVVINGIFPTPAGLVLAGPDGMTVSRGSAQVQQSLSAFHLKPIFKYPAWKYPGQYAD